MGEFTSRLDTRALLLSVAVVWISALQHHHVADIRGIAPTCDNAHQTGLKGVATSLKGGLVAGKGGTCSVLWCGVGRHASVIVSSACVHADTHHQQPCGTRSIVLTPNRLRDARDDTWLRGFLSRLGRG